MPIPRPSPIWWIPRASCYSRSVCLALYFASFYTVFRKPHIRDSLPVGFDFSASGSLSAKSVLTVACVYSHRVRADTNVYTLRAKCNAILVSLFWHSCLTTLSSLTRPASVDSMGVPLLSMTTAPDLNRPVISCQFRLYVVEWYPMGDLNSTSAP